MFEIVGSYVYDGATDTLTETEIPSLNPYEWGQTCPTNWGLMREGFDVDTIRRMRFMRWLYQHGKLVS